MFNLTPETEAASLETEQTRLQELALTSIELARIVASNLNAAPELLVHLAYSGDKQTRQNIVSNPNTPTNLLLKLGAEFPQELINNPIFSLLMLENPNLVEEMPALTLASLLKIDVAPPGWMFAAAKHDDIDVLNLLINNPDTPKEALKIREAKLRALYGDKCPSVIILGDNDVAVAVKAIKNGAEDYLVKQQLTKEVLIEAVRNAVTKIHIEQNEITQVVCVNELAELNHVEKA